MKQVLILTLIFACNGVAKAQNTPFTVGFFLAPAYSDRFNVDAFLLKDLFVGNYAYSIGIFAQKSMTNRLDLRYGANFVNNSEQMLRRDMSNGVLFINQYMTIISNSYNVELPIDIQYFMNRKKHFFVSLGASPSYNLFDAGTIKRYTGDRLTSTNTSTGKGEKGIAVAVQVGIGYQKQLNRNLLFEIQPKFRTYITKLDNSRSMYNVALQMGLLF